MTREECRTLCTAEERAYYNGWNFTHLGGRWEEETVPWDFREEIAAWLDGESSFLDLASGGYGFLLSLNPKPGQAFYAEPDEQAAAILRQRFARSPGAVFGVVRQHIPFGVCRRQFFNIQPVPGF